MGKIELLFRDQTNRTGYLAPTVLFMGAAESRLGTPDGFSQWVVASEVEPGSTLSWRGDQGDEAIYLQSGSVIIDGDVACESGGVVIVERGATPTIEVEKRSSLLHFGQAEAQHPKRPAEVAPVVHVIDARGLQPPRKHRDPNVGVNYFADGKCEGCDVVLFRISGTAPHVEHPHYHSTDEIIHLTSGVLSFGDENLDAGMSIAIASNKVYTFETNDVWAYVNYRSSFADAFSPDGERFVFK